MGAHSMASKGKKPDGRSSHLPLGRLVRRRDDPTGIIGVIAAVIFESPYCALVVWRDESSTFERLDMLIEVIEALKTADVGNHLVSPLRDAEVDQPERLERLLQWRLARTRRPLWHSRMASSIAVIVAIALASPMWDRSHVGIDVVPDPRRVPTGQESAPVRDPLPHVSLGLSTVASSPAPRATQPAAAKPATTRDDTRSAARRTVPISRDANGIALARAADAAPRKHQGSGNRSRPGALKHLVGYMPEVTVGTTLVRWVKSQPTVAPLPQTERESHQAP
jgi:hypothetical protein